MTDQPKPMETIKAGRLLMIDSGQYSDYGVTGFFVVLQDFVPMQKLAEFAAANPNKIENFRFETSEFLASLIKQGLLMDIDYSNLYLGDYGNIRSVEFRP